jgi:squalene cyclase
MEELLKKAGDYLVKSQNADGSWGDGDPYICARALYASLETGAPQNAIDAGISYILGCQDKDGCFKGKTISFSDAMNTAYPLIVLSKFHYHKASPPISKGIMWLIETQNEDGSWSGRNKTKNAYTTTMCLRAIHNYGFSGISKFQKGIEYSNEYMGNLIFYREPVSHIYYPIINLQRMSYLKPETKERFMKYAERTLKTCLFGSRFVDVTYLMGALKALDEKEESEIASEMISCTQNEDGSFAKDNTMISDTAYTSLVVLAMKNKL